MSDSKRIQRAVKALQDVGLDVLTPDQSNHDHLGFVVQLPLANDESLAINLEKPPFLMGLEQSHVGAATMDSLGFVTAAWGLAHTLDSLREGRCALESPIQDLVKDAFRGRASTLYLDGIRYYATPVDEEDVYQVFVLVVDASEERTARVRARSSLASASALKSIGRTLSSHQTIERLCEAAVKEISDALDASAAMIWVARNKTEAPQLQAWTGARRADLRRLKSLDPHGGTTCAAELAISHGDVLCLQDVRGSYLTRDFEAEFCYVDPGALAVMPLKCGDKLVGVLEIVGKQGDETFLEKRELFSTIAEHLALAVNSAIMFEEMEQLASRDALTGIPNHRTMQEFLHSRVSEASRNGSELAVIMLDVDHFRRFNEQEGHDAGDIVLKMVANLLGESIREYDMAARYGGEEFTLIMPGLGKEAALSFAERLRSRIEELQYENAAGEIRSVTASLGCAVFPSDASDANTLLKAADIALFQAKRNGRNLVSLYEGEPISSGSRQVVNPERLIALLPPEYTVSAKNRLESYGPSISALSEELKLDEHQVGLLRAGFAAWEILSEETCFGNEEAHRRFREAPELEPVLELVEQATRTQIDDLSSGSLAETLRTLSEYADGNLRETVATGEGFNPKVLEILRRLDPAA